jgi:site-specific recombinase XerD
MKPVGPTLQALVQDFFVQHLTVERNASRHTVLAYRDALKLFLRYSSSARNCSPDELDHSVFDPGVVRSFLAWLERERRCGPRTRNHRLAALKAFARYVAAVAPEHLERCRQVREISPARFEHREVEYLDDDEVVQLIRAIGGKAATRDRALLLLLYNTGARVQEIAGLDVADFHDQAIPFIRLRGKGRRQRTCPLWTRTVEALRTWLTERENPPAAEPLFLNARAQRISRSGVAHLLRQLALRAGLQPRHASHLSPHVLRHTTAMHLLQSGVDITTIAAWLGHAQIATTHEYVEIDLRMKQAAIARATTSLPELSSGDFPSSDLVTWLERIGRPLSYVQQPERLARQESFTLVSSA